MTRQELSTIQERLEDEFVGAMTKNGAADAAEMMGASFKEGLIAMAEALEARGVLKIES